MFEFQQRILRSATIGIEELKLDSRVLKHLNQDGTLKTPKPEDFRKMMQDINDAFCSRDPKNEQLYRYKKPALVLDKALIGWHADMSQ
jgi:hypothetical protein